MTYRLLGFRWMVWLGLAACLPQAPEVISYEHSYGECIDMCDYLVTREADRVTLEVGFADSDIEPVFRTSVLTEEGVTAWEDGERTLRGIDSVTGCPGCLDGGVVELVMTHENDGESTHRWERDAPPERAEAFDAVATELLDALARCTATDLMEDIGDCEPL